MSATTSQGTLHDSASVTVRRLVRKTWKIPEHNLAADEVLFYTTAKGIRGIPELLGHGPDYVELPWFPKDFGQTRNLKEDGKRKVGFQIVDTIWGLFCRGVSHSDLFPSNIMLSQEDEPYLIDPLINFYGPNTQFRDCFDLCGLWLTPKRTEHKDPQCSFGKFVGPELGVAVPEAVNYVHDMLHTKAIACSGTETYNDLAPRGIAYSSIDFPGLFSCKGWRDTDKRFEQLGVKGLANKTTCDVGAGVGAFPLKAAQLGASLSVGVEFSKDRVEVGNKIAKFLGLREKVQMVCSDALRAAGALAGAKLPSSFDVCFCMALGGRVSDEAALMRTVAAATKEAAYYETNEVGDKQPEHYSKLLREAGFAAVKLLGKDQEGFPKRYRFEARKA